MKKNIKDLNIWKYLHKISNSEEEKMSDSEKLNLLNDGWGNVYLPPKSGETPLFRLDGDDTFLYRYNFKSREIEAFVQRNLPDCNNYEFVESMGIGIGDFVDGPEYWVNKFATELQDSHYQEAEQIMQSSESLFGDDFLDKEEYEYLIKAQVTINIFADTDFHNHMYDAEENYKNYIQSLSKKTYLYTEPLEIDCSYSELTGYVYIKCVFTMPMTKEDLMDIWDEYEPLINNPETSDYVIVVDDLEMNEI